MSDDYLPKLIFMAKKIKGIGPTRPQLLTSFQNKFGSVDGILHVTLTKNNTLLTLTDVTGDVLT